MNENFEHEPSESYGAPDADVPTAPIFWPTAPLADGPSAAEQVAPPSRRRRRSVPAPVALALAMGVAGAAAGAGIGHAVWSTGSAHSSASTSPVAGQGTGGQGSSGGSPYGFGGNPFGSGGSPFGSGGSGGFGSGGFGSGSSGSTGGSSSSSATGAPSDAASIAKDVDPGLVDITTTLGYEDAEAAGTGMVLTSNGEVLTNNHVIDGATKISVRDIGNGKSYSATVVGYDRTQDVAVLQLKDASGLTTVTPSTTASKSGAAVVGIGNAGGTGGTPSYAGGEITATDRSITASDDGDGTSEKLTGLIETNADIQAGDSGGPLVDEQGHVVGMDTAASEGFQFSSSSGSAGSEGFAIPIAQALSIASQITAGDASSVVHIGPTALLGVDVESGSAQGSQSFGGFGSGSASGGSSSGAVIAGVVSGGPAAKAGLVAGDVITSVDGKAVSSPNALTGVMTTESPGATVQVGYTDASGAKRTANVDLGSGPPQ